MRFVLLALLVVALLIWLTPARRKDTRAAGMRRPASGEPMHQCAHCGAFFPASEAVKADSGEIFCSNQHRVLHAGR